MLECSLARCVWALADGEMVEHMIHSIVADGRTWLTHMQESLSHVAFVNMVVTLWAVWYARRKAIYDHELQSPFSTNMFIRRYIQEIGDAKVKLGSSRVAPAQTNNFVRPPVGVIKINVDGVVARDRRSGVGAAIARDHTGLYRGSSSCYIPHMYDLATLEVMACREGLWLAKDLMLDNIIISSDCASVVRDINNGGGGRYEVIIREIRETISEFNSCRFIFESRRKNFEADGLAKFSISLESGRHMWLVQPHDLVTILMKLI